jgi:hypothetical protein
LAALDLAKRHFDRVSFDLIYAREGQNARAWREELGLALSNAADHLSLYQLTIEPGTPFAARHEAGTLRTPNGAEARAQYLRTQELCAVIASDYDGDAAAVWTGARDGADLERRLLALPGIGEMKARTMIGVIAKRLGVRPAGWEEYAPAWHSLGDVDSPQALVEYQAAKRAHKAALRAQQTA